MVVIGLGSKFSVFIDRIARLNNDKRAEQALVKVLGDRIARSNNDEKAERALVKVVG